MIKYIFEESVRRVVQMFFGMEIFSFPILQHIRGLAFRCVFKMGKSPVIEEGVRITRKHGIQSGSIEFGDHVLLARGVHIDYTGNVIIGNDVAISSNVEIETHNHPLRVGVTRKESKETVPNRLVIGDGAWIGTHAIILSGVNKIGKDAVIGAGAVINKNIPDGAVVSGNPAKKYGSIYDL